MPDQQTDLNNFYLVLKLNDFSLAIGDSHEWVDA